METPACSGNTMADIANNATVPVTLILMSRQFITWFAQKPRPPSAIKLQIIKGLDRMQQLKMPVGPFGRFTTYLLDQFSLNLRDSASA